MPRFNPYLICVVFVTLGLAKGCSDKEPPPKKINHRDFSALISQLVSPNQEADTQNGGDARATFPKNYDFDAQRRIDAARQELYDNIEASLSYLVEALDDPRYCMTINWADGDAYYNWSVGKVCRDIITSQLEVYRDRISYAGPRDWNNDNFPVSKTWWQSRKDYTLSQLQVDAIDWAIERRKTIKGTEGLLEKTNTEISDLKKFRDEIISSKKSAKPNRMLRMLTVNK